ncbi:MAG: FMN-binding protein [Bacteroidales bacterium]|nr:FMN-binding protein [Bacteroidales bacterium]
MKNLLIAIALTFTFAGCNAQKSQPVPDDIKPAFPTAQSVTLKKNLYTVSDNKGKVIGYAAYSKPASDGINGFKGETPLLVVFGTDKKVKQVILLPNMDTPGYVEHMKKGGLLNAWNGLTPKEALSKDVDAVAGATYTSRGVINTMKKTLENIKL